MSLEDLASRVSAARAATEARGETFYPGPSRIHLAAFPPKERWDDWVELDSKRLAAAGRAPLHARADDLLQLRVGVRPARLRRPRDAARSASSKATPSIPARAGATAPRGRRRSTRSPIPTASSTRSSAPGARGEGKWERVSWDEALDDIAARIRKAIVEGRRNEVMYHVGRPGEDGYTERMLAAWGVDGHNSHTNICSSGARAGYQLLDGARPAEPRPRQRRGHPAHQRAPRVRPLLQPARAARHGRQGATARSSSSSTRGSRTPRRTPTTGWRRIPGSEAAILLAIANHLIQTRRYDREFVRRWWNWQEYLEAEQPELAPDVRELRGGARPALRRLHLRASPRRVGRRRGGARRVAELVAGAGTRLSTHTWRSAAAGNLGGWQVARSLFLLNALLGAVATEGGTYPNAWNKFVPQPIHTAAAPGALERAHLAARVPAGA